MAVVEATITCPHCAHTEREPTPPSELTDHHREVRIALDLLAENRTN